MSNDALVPLPGAIAGIGPAGAERAVPSLAALVSRFLRWFQFVRERSEHTIEAYAYDLQDFVRFATGVGIEDPRAVRLQLVEAYLATLRHRHGLAVATVNRRRSCLVAFFKYLLREGLIEQNPAALVEQLRGGRRLPRRLTVRERDYVLDQLAQDDTPLGRRDLAIVAAGCLAGLRCEEITTLRLENVDLDGGRLRVIGKGEKEREVPIVGRLGAILARYLEVRPRLLGAPVGELYRRTPSSPWRIRCPGPGGDVRVNTHTYSYRQARAQLEALAPRVPDSPYLFVNAHPRRGHALRRGGRPLERRTVFRVVRLKVTPLVGRPVSPHTLRHTFASVLTERGANPLIVQRVMGHERLETTSIYVHLSNDTIRHELEKHLEGAPA